MRFLRRSHDKPFVLFFATDLHGSEKCFLKFLNAAKFYEADGLVLGGDLTGKGLVPVVQTNGGYRVEIQGRVEAAVAESDVREIERRIRFNGFYPAPLPAGRVGAPASRSRVSRCRVQPGHAERARALGRDRRRARRPSRRPLRDDAW